MTWDEEAKRRAQAATQPRREIIWPSFHCELWNSAIKIKIDPFSDFSISSAVIDGMDGWRGDYWPIQSRQACWWFVILIRMQPAPGWRDNILYDAIHSAVIMKKWTPLTVSICKLCFVRETAVLLNILKLHKYILSNTRNRQNDATFDLNTIIISRALRLNLFYRFWVSDHRT